MLQSKRSSSIQSKQPVLQENVQQANEQPFSQGPSQSAKEETRRNTLAEKKSDAVNQKLMSLNRKI